MATERQARELSEYFKFRQHGQAVAGQIDKFFGPSGQYNTFSVVFAPAILRQSKDGKAQKFGSIAINLSGDLLAKLDMRKDVGKLVSIIYAKDEPSKKGSDKRVFKVLELSEDEFKQLDSRASAEFANNAYKAPKAADGAAAEDDDLPF